MVTAIKTEIIERFLGDLSNSSEHVKKDRAYYVQKFLTFAGDRPFSEWNKTLVGAFMEELKRDYSKGTQRKIFGILKRTFDAAKAVHEAERTRLISRVNPEDPKAIAEILKAMVLPGPTWDIGKRSAPRLERGDEIKPAVTLDEIGAIAGAAKKGILEPADAAFMSLASVYGLRCEELRRIRPEHIDFDKHLIFVDTAKGGEKRHQLLADELLPILKEYDFAKECSLYKIHEMYWRAESRAGLMHKKRGGLHEFRRYLDTTLVDLLAAPGIDSKLYCHIFLRWKVSSSSIMTDRYYVKSPLEIDRYVLERNPVVPLWR